MCLLSGACDTQFYVNMTNILGVLISGLSVTVVILLEWEITSFVRFKKMVGMDISKAVDNMNNKVLDYIFQRGEYKVKKEAD